MSNLPGKLSGNALISSGAGLLKKLVFDEVPDAKNHRQEPRQPVAGEVILVELDDSNKRTRSHRVFIRDLSKSGCGLWCRARINAGSKIAVIFQNASGEPVQRLAEICHCRGQDSTGFALGVRFTTGNQPVTHAA